MELFYGTNLFLQHALVLQQMSKDIIIMYPKILFLE